MALSSSSAQVAASSVPVLGHEPPTAAATQTPTNSPMPEGVQLLPLYATLDAAAEQATRQQARPAKGRSQQRRSVAPKSNQPPVLSPITKPFLLGQENRLLRAALQRLMAAAESDRQSVPSPVVIVGPTGSGKTHLCRGLVEHWQQPSPSPPATSEHGKNALGGVFYLSASEFRRDLATVIDQDEVALLRESWRGARLLVIDDLHRFAPIERLCEELRQTIDAIQAGGGMVVAASSTTLAATDLPRSLISRFTAGLTVEIAPSGNAVREELLMLCGAEIDCRIAPQAAELLAQAMPGEARHLAGIAVELRRHYGRQVSHTQAEHYLKQNNRLPTPPAREIIRLVSAHYRVPQKVLQSASRKQTAVQARAVAIYLIRELTPLSYEQIGRTLGGRDHTTVMHNYRRITQLLPKDRALQSVLSDLRQSLATAYPQAANTALNTAAGGPTC